jgi:hypothetical protein
MWGELLFRFVVVQYDPSLDEVQIFSKKMVYDKILGNAVA